MDKAEIQQKIESSFQPYDCRVEFLPRGQPDWEELGIQLSEVNYKLPVFERKVARNAVEDILDDLIKVWREEVEEIGYRLDYPVDRHRPRTMVPPLGARLREGRDPC